MTSRIQRYRLTLEFILRDRADYSLYVEMFRAFVQKLDEHPGFQSDYLATEKIEEEKRNG